MTAPCRSAGEPPRFLGTTRCIRSLVMPVCVGVLLYGAIAGCGDTEKQRVGECLPADRVPDEGARQTTRDLTEPLDFDLTDVGNPLPVLVVDTLGKEVVDEPKIDGVLSLFDTLAGGDPAFQVNIGIELRYPKKARLIAQHSKPSNGESTTWRTRFSPQEARS
jgi:hypothetical protein